MIQYICDICQAKMTPEEFDVNGSTIQISAQSNLNPDNEPEAEEYTICSTCLAAMRDLAKGYAENILHPNKKTDKQPVLETVTVEQFSPVDPEPAPALTPEPYYAEEYKGMLLRDFLRTPFYKEALCLFTMQDSQGLVITNYEAWMARRILSVSPPNAAHSDAIVVLE